MASIHSAILDIKRLDLLAGGSSALHRLDGRAKVLVTAGFMMTVVSFNRYDLSALLPFFVFPAAMIAVGRLPALFILRKISLICPLIVVIGMFNPIFDRDILVQVGPIGISAGWISFMSILLRSILTVGAAMILVGVTGFTAICRALERMGLPPVFTVQLLFLYRYIFVLAEESQRTAMARELRSFGKKGLGIGSFSSLIGHLLLRTWRRAERIHMAMMARGFTGQFHTRGKTRFGWPDAGFLIGWSLLFLLLRLENIPQRIGNLIAGLFS